MILVVDDEPQVCETMVALLTACGHHALAVGSAREAMSALIRHRIDLIILDICLPRIDGLQAAGLIRATHPFVPIVLLSGQHQELPRSTLRDLRIESVLSKPLDRQALERVIDQIASRMATTGAIVIPSQ